MASKMVKLKKLSVKKKAYLFGIISFFAFTLFFSIKAVLAYYNKTTPLSILASTIGDFDSGDGDVNMMIYKETGKGTNVFVRSYAVPAFGYKFNDSLTSCLMPCSDDDSAYECSVECDENSNCSYKYNDEDKSFDLSSNHKLTCKFYFNTEYESDINVYVMIEDEYGEKTYNSKQYAYKENIPAFGYKYVGYTCDNSVQSVSFDPITKKFIVETQTKNNCYAYFEKYGSSDLSVNVYVQNSVGSTDYLSVQSIPINNEYIINSSKSVCSDSNGQNTNAAIDYIDGYISIEASGKQTCDVYLDLAS